MFFWDFINFLPKIKLAENKVTITQYTLSSGSNHEPSSLLFEKIEYFKHAINEVTK